MDTAPRGFISIADIENVDIGVTAKNKQEFQLVTKDRVWNLAAIDVTSRENWISAIEDLQFDDTNAYSFSKYKRRTSSVWRSKCRENMIYVRSDSSSQ